MEVAVFRYRKIPSDWAGWLPKFLSLELIEFIPRNKSVLHGDGGVWKLDEDKRTVHILTKWLNHQSDHPSQEYHETKEGKFYLDLNTQIKIYEREQRLKKLLDE